MKKYILAVTCLFMASSVGAATIDFASVADGSSANTYYGVAGGEKGASSFTFTEGNITLTTTGYNLVTQGDDQWLTPKFAYLDSGNAGLGVCQTLSGTQCTPTSDDNVTLGETLRLVFSETVTIESITFVNGDHGTSFADGSVFVLNGSSLALANTFVPDGGISTGTMFDFHNPNAGSEGNLSNNKQFYINSITFRDKGLTPPEVPVPAAAWLFASGLLGLVGVARRKNV